MLSTSTSMVGNSFTHRPDCVWLPRQHPVDGRKSILYESGFEEHSVEVVCGRNDTFIVSRI